jgi:hypothetical protein
MNEMFDIDTTTYYTRVYYKPNLLWYQLLVHAHGRYIPVRIRERARVLIHVSRAVSWAAIGVIDSAGPVAAKGEVEDDVVRTKMRVNGAVAVGEERLGSAEEVGRERLDRRVEDRGNGGAAGEEPDLD